MPDFIYQLPISESLSPTLSFRQHQQHTLLVIEHSCVRAALSLQGAHLLSWQAQGQQEAFWLSPKTPFDCGKAIRGGVPICWPWFGKAANPAHGFARILPWTLTDYDDQGEDVHLTLTLVSSEESRSMWPFDFTVQAHFTLGQTCHVELVCYGDHTSTAALHSYFTIGAIDQVAISGLGDSYSDKMADGKTGQQDGPLRITEPTDRIYTKPESLTEIRDSKLQRTLQIDHHQHSDVVVWNPGAELAKAMNDVPDNSYHSFVCVETARIQRALISTAERPARLGFVLSIRQTD